MSTEQNGTKAEKNSQNKISSPLKMSEVLKKNKSRWELQLSYDVKLCVLFTGFMAITSHNSGGKGIQVVKLDQHFRVHRCWVLKYFIACINKQNRHNFALLCIPLRLIIGCARRQLIHQWYTHFFLLGISSQANIISNVFFTITNNKCLIGWNLNKNWLLK